MLQSKLFTKTRKEAPAQEEAKSAQLLLRAGFVEKLSAGIFAYLPLGYRVLHRIMGIVREEMSAIGAEEMLMPSLVAKEYWQKTGRWDVDVMYKLKDTAGSEFGLGWTHEEVITHLAKNFIQSYHDLPRALYQIQTKFRSEPRAKSGVLRGREFIMKDLYSFHQSEEDLHSYYEQVKVAYENVFKRVGLRTIIAEAAGGAFTKEYTHEFQAPAAAGEDTVFFCSKCNFAQNKEIAKVQQGEKCMRCGEGEIQETKAIEVGNIFKLGTRYSRDFELLFTAEDGKKMDVIMGCYGLGITRLMGTLAEVHSDARGIIWPESVAPFKVHLLGLDMDDASVARHAKKIYSQLQKRRAEVLFDDRKKSPGEKFSDADLLGIPYRVVVSKKTKAKAEVKKRDSASAKLVSQSALLKLLK